MRKYIFFLLLVVISINFTYSQNTISVTKKNSVKTQVIFGGLSDGTILKSILSEVNSIQTTDSTLTITSFDLFYRTDNQEVLVISSNSNLITPIMKKILKQLRNGEEFTIGNVKAINPKGEFVAITKYNIRVI